MRQVEPYQNRHADFYDHLYKDKPYELEASVVSALLKKQAIHQGESILELACGTGRHAEKLAHLGHRVQGIDYSKDMIRVAQVRVSTNPKVKVQHGDMRKLDFSAESFDGVICLFDSIGYLLDNNSISRALSEAHRVLKKDGLIIFEFWHAPAMLKSFDAKRERIFETSNSKVKRVSETIIDPVLQQARVTFKFEEADSSGKVSRFEETQVNRFFQCQEIDLFLTSAGFKNVQVLNAYEIKQPIGLDTWHVLALGKK